MPDLQSLMLLPILAGLTVVLGIDNMLSIGVVSTRIDPSQRMRARAYGLALALISRMIVLTVLVRMLQAPHVTLPLVGREIAFQQVVKLAGGIYLVGKSLAQILDRARPDQWSHPGTARLLSLRSGMLQIMFIDQTQSLDSLVTVVGMASNIPVMVAAIVIELTVILFFSAGVCRLIEKYPTIQTLAVCALLLVGITLISEGVGMPIPRKYIYSMMAFALLVEIVDLKIGRQARPTLPS